MPPDRGRASRACTACRKIKTRCYESDVTGRPCLRCERLGQACSLDAVRNDGAHRGSILTDNRGSGSHEDRLSRLEQTVSSLVKRLGEDGAHRRTSFISTASPNPIPENDASSGIHSTAPVLLIRDVAYEVGVRQQHTTGVSPRSTGDSSDIISKGLITTQQASEMIELFHKHYGRWVAFSPTALLHTILEEVRQSPLLLCACSLIAIRHSAPQLAPILAPQLFQEARTLLASALLDTPQSIEFFQATIILSMWSTTIGQTPLSIDSWLVSGFALQHSLASDIFAPIISPDHSTSVSRSELDRWCIWNHLCLAHLHYCVGTRRRSILDRKQINECRKILDSDHATNFETRMVAEVNLYWIIYESCLKVPVDLPSTQAALHEWRQEWKFLFDQPRSQFLQMGFQFAQLLAFDQALKSRSAAVRESLVSEMIRLSASIIQLALDTADARTRHLSDHVYHMITFAAVTLCRLLHMYESQVASSHNLLELDSLVLTLITWLHSIGLPCHVAHTLGDVVSAFHIKLRPNTYSPSDSQTLDELRLYFPDLLGMESLDGGNYDFLPDWEPQNQ